MTRWLALAAVVLCTAPSQGGLRDEFQRVLNDAPIEPPAANGSRTLVFGATEADLNRDGRTEALVWIAPRARQTPTLLLFVRDGDNRFVRHVEGLVPGRLVKVSGAQHDSHTSGNAVDMTAAAPGGGAPAVDRILGAGLRLRQMSMVAYDGFIHAERREGMFFIANATGIALPAEGTNTCEAFEFDDVEQVVVGKVAGRGDSTFVAALTERDITVFHIVLNGSDERLGLRRWNVERGEMRALSLDRDGQLVVMRGTRAEPLTLP